MTTVSLSIEEFDKMREDHIAFNKIKHLCKHLIIKETDKMRPEERVFAGEGGQEYLGLNHRQMELLLLKIRKLV
jgi:hypothetical protein